jgi:predicted TIM-barrel fold metal-dependent hydrolase
VNTHHVEGAIREIKQWQDHPGMVQIGLPLQTLTPYGRPEYTPLWKAIADSGLPAVIHSEYGRGISHPPTPSGVTRTFSHLHAYRGTTYIYHLMNMIAEGVFQSFPDLKVIWADGGSDMVTPFMWRMDTFGRPHLEQTPWAPRIPSDYLADTNYFIFTKFDGPGDAPYASEWLSFTGKEDLLMFGSAYPSWKTHAAADLPSGWTEGQRSRVLGDTAAKVFGLDQLVAA